MAWKIEVIEIQEINEHPNADRLEVAQVDGQPVIIRKSEYKAGDKAVYIPIDSVVPENDNFAFLKGYRRIKAKKLRGIFSMGMLFKARPDWKLGQDVQEQLEIKKYDPELIEENKYIMGHEIERPPFTISKYDIDNARKFHKIIETGEKYIVCEKIHGCNSRFVWNNNRMWAGSRGQWKKPSDKDLWWKMAKKYDLEEKLKTIPNFILFGESYGNVQDVKYGSQNGECWFASFDLYDLQSQQFINYDSFISIMNDLEIPTVPQLYEGVWDENSFDKCLELAEGKTIINDSGVVREGCIIKLKEGRWDKRVGRVILKIHGEGFLLRKSNTGK